MNVIGKRILPKQAPVLFGKAAYKDLVVGLSPLVYWPLDETSGSAASNLGTLGPAANGSYSGPTLADAAGPFGGAAPYFDGSNDSVTCYSNALRDAISWAEGSLAIWSRLEALDNQTRVQLMPYSGSNDYVEINKTSNTAGQYQWVHKINGVTKADQGDAGGMYASLGWLHFGLTWSVAADEARCYVQGTAPAPGTLVMSGLGSNPTALLTSCTIGRIAYTTAQYWQGWLCHAAIWDRALAAGEMQRLAQG